ncbi:Hypothetical protein, putative [Bodo saltans]|uniref:Uncharacterized protein n=1 Tax=Bodo saltans TaxID=75058 RepID=A0A0S4JTA2_BODSA|nr:Hypothetical protein, putative [Bodo saltans]|eukprot:CUG92582.1 Hypothetical protein, putative [Bodo saltans]
MRQSTAHLHNPHAAAFNTSFCTSFTSGSANISPRVGQSTEVEEQQPFHSSGRAQSHSVSGRPSVSKPSKVALIRQESMRSAMASAILSPKNPVEEQQALTRKERAERRWIAAEFKSGLTIVMRKWISRQEAADRRDTQKSEMNELVVLCVGVAENMARVRWIERERESRIDMNDRIVCKTINSEATSTRAFASFRRRPTLPSALENCMPPTPMVMHHRRTTDCSTSVVPDGSFTTSGEASGSMFASPRQFAANSGGVGASVSVQNSSPIFSEEDPHTSSSSQSGRFGPSIDPDSAQQLILEEEEENARDVFVMDTQEGWFRIVLTKREDYHRIRQLNAARPVLPVAIAAPAAASPPTPSTFVLPLALQQKGNGVSPLRSSSGISPHYSYRQQQLQLQFASHTGTNGSDQGENSLVSPGFGVGSRAISWSPSVDTALSFALDDSTYLLTQEEARYRGDLQRIERITFKQMAARFLLRQETLSRRNIVLGELRGFVGRSLSIVEMIARQHVVEAEDHRRERLLAKVTNAASKLSSDDMSQFTGIADSESNANSEPPLESHASFQQVASEAFSLVELNATAKPSAGGGGADAALLVEEGVVVYSSERTEQMVEQLTTQGTAEGQHDDVVIGAIVNPSPVSVMYVSHDHQETLSAPRDTSDSLEAPTPHRATVEQLPLTPLIATASLPVAMQVDCETDPVVQPGASAEGVNDEAMPELLTANAIVDQHNSALSSQTTQQQLLVVSGVTNESEGTTTQIVPPGKSADELQQLVKLSADLPNDVAGVPLEEEEPPAVTIPLNIATTTTTMGESASGGFDKHQPPCSNADDFPKSPSGAMEQQPLTLSPPLANCEGEEMQEAIIDATVVDGDAFVAVELSSVAHVEETAVTTAPHTEVPITDISPQPFPLQSEDVTTQQVSGQTEPVEEAPQLMAVLMESHAPLTIDLGMHSGESTTPPAQRTEATFAEREEETCADAVTVEQALPPEIARAICAKKQPIEEDLPLPSLVAVIPQLPSEGAIAVPRIVTPDESSIAERSLTTVPVDNNAAVSFAPDHTDGPRLTFPAHVLGDGAVIPAVAEVEHEPSRSPLDVEQESHPVPAKDSALHRCADNTTTTTTQTTECLPGDVTSADLLVVSTSVDVGAAPSEGGEDPRHLLQDISSQDTSTTPARHDDTFVIDNPSMAEQTAMADPTLTQLEVITFESQGLAAAADDTCGEQVGAEQTEDEPHNYQHDGGNHEKTATPQDTTGSVGDVVADTEQPPPGEGEGTAAINSSEPQQSTPAMQNEVTREPPVVSDEAADNKPAITHERTVSQVAESLRNLPDAQQDDSPSSFVEAPDDRTTSTYPAEVDAPDNNNDVVVRPEVIPTLSSTLNALAPEASPLCTPDAEVVEADEVRAVEEVLPHTPERSLPSEVDSATPVLGMETVQVTPSVPYNAGAPLMHGAADKIEVRNGDSSSSYSSAFILEVVHAVIQQVLCLTSATLVDDNSTRENDSLLPVAPPHPCVVVADAPAQGDEGTRCSATAPLELSAVLEQPTALTVLEEQNEAALVVARKFVEAVIQNALAIVGSRLVSPTHPALVVPSKEKSELPTTNECSHATANHVQPHAPADHVPSTPDRTALEVAEWLVSLVVENALTAQPQHATAATRLSEEANEGPTKAVFLEAAVPEAMNAVVTVEIHSPTIFLPVNDEAVLPIQQHQQVVPLSSNTGIEEGSVQHLVDLTTLSPSEQQLGDTLTSGDVTVTLASSRDANNITDQPSELQPDANVVAEDSAECDDRTTVASHEAEHRRLLWEQFVLSQRAAMACAELRLAAVVVVTPQHNGVHGTPRSSADSALSPKKPLTPSNVSRPAVRPISSSSGSSNGGGRSTSNVRQIAQMPPLAESRPKSGAPPPLQPRAHASRPSTGQPMTRAAAVSSIAQSPKRRPPLATPTTNDSAAADGAIAATACGSPIHSRPPRPPTGSKAPPIAGRPRAPQPLRTSPAKSCSSSKEKEIQFTPEKFFTSLKNELEHPTHPSSPLSLSPLLPHIPTASPQGGAPPRRPHTATVVSLRHAGVGIVLGRVASFSSRARLQRALLEIQESEESSRYTLEVACAEASSELSMQHAMVMMREAIATGSFLPVPSVRPSSAAVRFRPRSAVESKRGNDIAEDSTSLPMVVPMEPMLPDEPRAVNVQRIRQLLYNFPS